MTELMHIPFTVKNRENFKPIPRKPQSTTQQRIGKAVTLGGDKLCKLNIERAAGLH